MTQGPRNRILRALLALVALVLGRRRSPPEPPSRDEPPLTAEREVGARRRSENVALVLLAAATLAAIGFSVDYVADPDTQVLGLCLGAALVLIGAAAALAGKRVVPREKAVGEYHEFGDERRQEEVQAIVSEPGEGVSRRRLLVVAGGTAGATLGAALVVPAASLGPRVRDRVLTTPWRRGVRLVDSHERPIDADAVAEGTMVSAFPDGAPRDSLGASLLVVRIPSGELDMSTERQAGAPEGIVAYSKICPHAGCAVSIYRHPLNPPTAPEPALVCPCHYSTFDPRRAGALVFGPAGRDLPQLPLQVNAGRQLEAAGDFFDPIGPSYGGIRTR